MGAGGMVRSGEASQAAHHHQQLITDNYRETTTIRRSTREEWHEANPKPRGYAGFGGIRLRTQKRMRAEHADTLNVTGNRQGGGSATRTF